MIYFMTLALMASLNSLAKTILPARMQLLFADDSGDLTTTMSWLLGIAVIAGVGIAIYTGIIAPNMVQATNRTNGLINAIP